MTPLNGKAAAQPASPPQHVIAERIYTRDMDEGDAAWADLDFEEREAVANYVEAVLHAHVEFLAAAGFKLVPPGATPVPKTDDAAMAMVQAAKSYFDGKKRKGKLMDAVAPRKLILPKGAH